MSKIRCKECTVKGGMESIRCLVAGLKNQIDSLEYQINSITKIDCRKNQFSSIVTAPQQHPACGAGLTNRKMTVPVGKRPGKGVYVHVNAIRDGLSNLRPKELAAYEKALRLVPDFGHELAHISGNTVRLLKMSSLCDPHPHVIKSKKVHLATGKVCDGKRDGQLFHRLDTIISPRHPAFAFHHAVSRFEEAKGLIGNGAPTESIGRRAKWEAWIESMIGMSAYKNAIQGLQRRHLETITPAMIKAANRTANLRRKRWPASVTPEYVIETSESGDSVLNFGCGVPDKDGEIPDSRKLEESGLVVTNYDFGTNAHHGEATALKTANTISSWPAMSSTCSGPCPCFGGHFLRLPRQQSTMVER